MRVTTFCLLVICSVPDLARAQSPVVAPGEVVKVWSDAAGLRGARGTVEAVQTDSFDVRPAGAPKSTHLAWTSVTRLDVARGKRSKWRGALIWGACFGLAGALIAGSLTSNDADKEATVPLAGWAGFGIGAIFGAHLDATKWVRVR